MVFSELQQEALKYDLPSLLQLQEKRQQNVQLFEQAIKNERSAAMQEATAQANLEEKMLFHNAKLIKLSDADQYLIRRDIPKLKSTQDKRKENIVKLQQAILEEQGAIDREHQMIMFLETHHDISQ